MTNFTNDDDGMDEFQEILNGLSGLTPIQSGKRGGGRKATNNIGADVLGMETLKDLRNNHRIDLSIAENLRGNTLWGVIDQQSFNRAKQISRNIKPSYSQAGIYAVSLAQNAEKAIFIQWWKATLVNGVLSFQKVFRDGEDFQLLKDKNGRPGLWKMDSTTGLPEKKTNGDYIPFRYNELVDFEVYLNALVVTLEVPVSFPESEINNLRGLSEILAGVNLTNEEMDEVSSEMEEVSSEDGTFEDEEE